MRWRERKEEHIYTATDIQPCAFLSVWFDLHSNNILPHKCIIRQYIFSISFLHPLKKDSGNFYTLAYFGAVQKEKYTSKNLTKIPLTHILGWDFFEHQSKLQVNSLASSCIWWYAHHIEEALFSFHLSLLMSNSLQKGNINSGRVLGMPSMSLGVYIVFVWGHRVLSSMINGLVNAFNARGYPQCLWLLHVRLCFIRRAQAILLLLFYVMDLWLFSVFCGIFPY